MRFIAILCLLLTQAVFSQSKGTRTCRIVFLGGGENDPQKLFLFDGKKAQEVDLPRMNFSETYSVAGGPLTIRLLKSAPVEGQPINEKAPVAKLTEGTDDFYLLVSPDPSNKFVPVRLQVIDASAQKFKAGHMLWYNLTANDVGGQVGEQKLVIRGRSKLILDPPTSKNEDFPVNLSYSIPKKEGLYPLCETRWTHDPRARTVLFIVNEPGSRAPRVLGFPDHREDSGKNQ